MRKDYANKAYLLSLASLVLLLAVVAFTGATTAWAQTIDPSNLHIGPGLGTTCQAGCAGEPNLVGNSTIDVWNVSNGQSATLTNPLLLIIGIPNDSSGGTAAPATITLSIGTGVLGDAGYFGGVTANVNSNTGYAGSWSQSNKNDVYSFLNLSGADASNNWTNWSGAPGDSGVTSFGIYVYTLTVGSGLPAGSGVNVTFGSGLPNGTLIIAYGCQGTGNFFSTSTCSNNPNPYDTAFTESGDAQVPEPASIALFGSGLLTLAGMIRKRRKSVRT